MVGLSADEIRHQLQQMDPYEFEELVAEIWELEGYETSVSPGSRDEGIDIEAEKRDPYTQKDLIQVKCYAEGHNIGSQQIRNYATLYRQIPDADIVIIVTSSDFTSDAISLAKELNVKTVDGDKIAEIIQHDIEKFGLFEKELGKTGVTGGMVNGAEARIEEIISDHVGEELRSIRKKANNSKYTKGEEMDIRFLDGDGVPVEMEFKYLSLSHDFARFRIQVTNLDQPSSVDLAHLEGIKGVEDVGIDSEGTTTFTSVIGDISAECSVLSYMIHKFHPEFSEEDKLSLNEEIPDQHLEEDVSGDRETHGADNRQPTDKNRTDDSRTESKNDSSEGSSSKELFRLEEEYHRFNKK